MFVIYQAPWPFVFINAFFLLITGCYHKSYENVSMKKDFIISIRFLRDILQMLKDRWMDFLMTFIIYLLYFSDARQSLRKHIFCNSVCILDKPDACTKNR